MKKSRNILKGYFESGDKPTESQFVDLIDSFFHEEDGKMVTSVNETDPNNKIINFSDGTSLTISSGGGGTDANLISNISKAFADGVRNDSLRDTGNAAKSLLTVMNTNTGKVQISSLGENNEVLCYLTGQDYIDGVVQERVFLDLGEIYVFENLQAGSRITSSKGAYGYSDQNGTGSKKSPMPLACSAFSFTKTMFRSVRNFDTGAGKIYVANGGVASVVQLTDAAGTVVNGQTGIAIPPFGFTVLDGDGVKEYILESSNPVVAAYAGGMDTDRFDDSNIVMPLTDEGMTWSRAGFASALYASTKIKFWLRTGVTGDLKVTGPGTPANISSSPPVGTGSNLPNYQADGAVRLKAMGLISAFAGPDGGGSESTPMFPIKAFVQRIALPLYVNNVGTGKNNGLAFCSPYEGTVKIYQWNKTTKSSSLFLTLDLTRNTGGSVATIDDQLVPASALISADATEATVVLPGKFSGGYAEADVPVHCVINSQSNQGKKYRGTSGNSVNGIATSSDESITTGITPLVTKAEVKIDNATGLLVKKVINNLTGTWEVA